MHDGAVGAGTDWSFSDARRRLIQAARAQLPRHTASGRLDDEANRVVDCNCGWTGNGLGWAEHLDQVVRLAVDEGSVRPVRED